MQHINVGMANLATRRRLALTSFIAYKVIKVCTVKLGDKERFDKEQIGVKEPFPVTNCQFTFSSKL